MGVQQAKVRGEVWWELKWNAVIINKLIQIKGKGEERKGEERRGEERERELGAESLERQLHLQAIKFQLSHVSEVKVLWGAILFSFSLFSLFSFLSFLSFFLFFPNRATEIPGTLRTPHASHT